MNFAMTEDQDSILSGLDQLLARVPAPAAGSATPYLESSELDDAMADSGFLAIASLDGYGPLEAALLVERVSREAQVAEVGASALILPLLPVPVDTRPLAVVSGDAARAVRFLPGARLLLVDHGDHGSLIEVGEDAVESVESLLAYPYGRLRDPLAATATATRIDDMTSLRKRWRVALAAEAAGAMASALKLVVDHVTARYAFGRPLGAFQGIQHRLAMAAETVESTRYLAFRAAWSDDPADAATAAGFAQSRIAGFTYDLHQFSGAMGLTLEFPLHLWTYRLRALVGEIGGASRQAVDLATLTWGEAA